MQQSTFLYFSSLEMNSKGFFFPRGRPVTCWSAADGHSWLPCLAWQCGKAHVPKGVRDNWQRVCTRWTETATTQLPLPEKPERRLKKENPSRWKWVRSNTCKLENQNGKSLPFPHVTSFINNHMLESTPIKTNCLSFRTWPNCLPLVLKNPLSLGCSAKPTRKPKELIVQPCRRPALSQGFAAFFFCFFSFFLSNYRHIDLHLPVSPVPLSKTPRSKNELGPDMNRQQP